MKGKFIMKDGIRFFEDEVLGLIRADHFSPKRRECSSDVTDSQGPVEYKGQVNADASLVVRSFRGFRAPGR